jgi:hypothetical protein
MSEIDVRSHPTPADGLVDDLEKFWVIFELASGNEDACSGISIYYGYKKTKPHGKRHPQYPQL